MQLLKSLHGLPSVTAGTRHLSTRTKGKVQQPLYCYCCYATFSLVFFTQKSCFIFFLSLLFICQPVITFILHGFSCFVLFPPYKFSFAVSVIGTPEGLSTNCVCARVCVRVSVCFPACCFSVGWELLGTYSSSSSPSVSTKTLLTFAAKFSNDSTSAQV